MKVVVSIFSLCIISASAFSPSYSSSSRTSSVATTTLNAVSRRDALAWMPAAVAFVTMPKDADAATQKADKKAGKTSTPPAAATPYLGNVAGIYDDPNHPKGYRVIIAKLGSSSATMELKDDPKGRQFIIPVKVKTDKKKGVETVVIDFSVKGGPKDLLGVVGKDTITWPDGNVWKKQAGIMGVYTDPQHPKGYRAIRKESGSTVAVELNNNNTNKPAEVILAAKTGSSKKSGSTISIPFPGKTPEETNTVIGTLGDGFITFPDGNKWTKL